MLRIMPQACVLACSGSAEAREQIGNDTLWPRHLQDAIKQSYKRIPLKHCLGLCMGQRQHTPSPSWCILRGRAASRVLLPTQHTGNPRGGIGPAFLIWRQ